MTWTQIIIALTLYVVYIVIPAINHPILRHAIAKKTSIEFAYHYYFKKGRRVAIYMVAFLLGWLTQLVQVLVFLQTITGTETADKEAVNKIFRDDL